MRSKLRKIACSGLFAFILVCFNFYHTHAQTPGGVSSSLKLWLKANNGPENGSALPATNGDAISVWRDRSGNANDYTVVAGPTYQDNTLNFNPSVEILSGGFDGPAGAALTTNWSVFFVSQKLASDNNGRLFDGHISNYLWAHWGNYTNSIYLNGNPSNYNSGIATTTGIQNLHLHSYLRESVGGTVEARADGISLNTFGTSTSASGVRIDINQGAFTATEASHSRVGEMIIYDVKLTATEVNRVESYLGLKYGLTLAHDYLAASGTTVWDFAAFPGYNNNILGIGRDDASGLDQRKSTSLNAGADLTMDYGAAFGSDAQFIVVGDNNAANGTSSDHPGAYAKRLNKVWLARVTGAPGSVSLSFDLTDLGLPTALNPSDYVLLVDGDDTFADATTSFAGASVANRVVTFNGVSLADQNRFTIAVVSSALKGPAYVTDNLKLWLKANTGVSGTTPVTVWNDQSGNGHHATVPGNGPDLLNSQLNGNPVLDFTSSNSEFMQVNSGIMGSSTYSNLWTYVVHKADVIQTNTILYENLAGGERMSVLLPWSNSDVYFDYANGGGGRLNGASGATINNYSLWTLGSSTSTSTPNGTNKTIYRDGAVILSNASNDSGTGNNQPFLIGGGYATGLGTSNPFDGKLAEMIIYTGVPSELDQEKIHSYLSIKYGLTKQSGDIVATAGQDERDYFSSNGTVIWDYSANTTYHNNVAGIGRDDASELDQQQSRSSNASSDVTINKGGAFGTDQSFIVWGDDNAANGTSANTPAGYAKRLSKVWKANVTGAPGAVSFSIDLTDLGLPISLAPADYALIIKNADTDFSSGATIHTTGAAIGSAQLSFTGVNFSDGDYFTIAVSSAALKGPANVTNNLKLWLKANTGVSGTTPVTAWNDQSGNGYHATVPGNGPDLLNSQLNGNPVLDFTSSNSEYMQVTSGLMGTSTYSNLWTYIVHKADVIQTNTILYENLAGGERMNVLLPWSNSDVYFDYANGGGGRLNGASGATINNYSLWTLGSSTATSTPNGTNKTIYRDGAVILSNASSDSGTGNNQPFLIGGGYATGLGTSNPFDGKLAEMIVYTGVPSELEQEKIHSYLSIKYGLTKQSGDIVATAGQDERDYFSSNGTVIWDYSANTTYHNNVAGIGRDDASELDQQQSRSSNAGSDVTISKGGAFGTDQSFIVWGDDNAANGTSADTPAGYAKRLSKVWKANVTGAPGAVSFSIDLTDLGLPISLAPADYALIIKNADTDFSSGATIHTTGAAIGSAQLSFTGVNFSDGDYFTIAVSSASLKGPANVTNNLKLWLKANTGVSGTTPVTAWNDQSGNGYHATVPGNGPDLLNSQLNGNPVLDFTSSNSEYMQINSGIMGSSTYSSLWAYIVHKADALQTNTMFYENLAGGERMNVLLPWGGGADVYFDYANGGGGRLNGASGATINNYSMWTLGSSTSTSTPNGTNKTIYRDGAVILSNASNDSGTGNNQPFLIGGGYATGLGTSNPFDGKIAEMIVYTGVPSELDQEKIHSYLSIKYGLTKQSSDIAATAGQDERNYFTSNGTIVWNYTTNSGYANRITAIGRDDASELDQRASRSVVSGNILTLDKTSAFGSNLDFVVTGDDGGVLTSTSANVPAPYTRRVTRVWRADLTGTPGTVSVSFDLTTGIHNSSNVADYALLIKNADTDFSSGATAHTTGATLVNNTITFTNVSLSDGDYFTLGLIVYTPAGAQTPIFWVKAGSGVTGTTNVSLWADQSGAGNNAVQATAANQPSLVTNDINFNPSIDFSGSTDVMTPVSAPANLNTTVFTVGVPTANTSWRTMFRGTVNDHPIIIQSGGTALGYYDNDNGQFRSSGFTWLQNETALVSLEMRAGDVNFRKNGTQGASITTIDLTGLSLNSFGNYQTNNQQFGRIAETIIYNTVAPLTTTEKEGIESYLAVKYGLTLTHNYLASNTNVIWNSTTNSVYNNRIIGIGRDDVSYLDQRKSKSVHSSSVLTIEKTTPAAGFGTDISYLLAGDDNGVLGASNASVHPSYPMRVARIWKAASSGSPGTVSVSFDLGTGIYNTGAVGDYALLINTTTPDFSTSTAHTAGASIVSNVITFPNITLPDGAFFTLALPRVASPGGVVNNLRSWLKADAGVTGGANASAWADQTSYNYVAVQATAANQPSVLANRANFNPALQFDGTNDQLSIASGIFGTATYNDVNVFVVSRVNTVQNSSVFFETQASGGRVNAHLPWGDNNVYWDAGSPAAPHRLNVNWGGAINTNYIWSLLASTTATAAGNLQNIFRNGTSLVSDGTMASFTGNNSNMFVGSNGTGSFFNGEVSELITYTGALSAAQYSQIQSYLAIKYGVTLDQTVPTNYVASNGAVVWDATANATYKVNIGGIGRDDASQLNQQKSRSINSTSIVTMDKGGAFSGDRNFIIWGSDNNYNAPTTVGKHPSYAYRLGKTWRVDVTGAPGSVSVSFDLGMGIYSTGNAADYSLLIGTAGSDFTAGTAHVTGASFNGSTLTFTNVTFTDGDYFTLGMPTPTAPGGVVNNMGIWFKANAGVTGVTNASAWADQSGNNFNVTQTTAANQPAIIASRANFNTSIQYDGTNDNLTLAGGILGTNSFTDVNAFVVSRANAITTSSLFWENTAGGQFDILSPWNNSNFYWDAGNAGTNRLNVSWGGQLNTSFLWGLTASTTATPSGQRQEIFRNGVSLGSDLTMSSFTGNNSTFYLGSGVGVNFFNGELSEMVIYRGALTSTMTQQIQSYLALKYGITLAGQDYLSSAGTSVYNTTTTHANYNRDIAGIGRDDNSALSQLKSQTVNTPVDLVTIANGDFTTPVAFSNSAEFLVWGHNGQPSIADPSAPGFTHGGATIVRSIARTWSTQKTGSPVGNAIVEIDMNLVIGPSGFGTNNTADIRLLVDNDAVFGNASAGESAYTGSVSGGKLYFTVPYSNINAGQGFFTVASVNATTAPISTPTPGGVIGDMRLWLKANAGVTGTTPVTTWADQSVNSRSAVIVGNGPDLLTDQINSNPAVDFTSASAEYLRIANGIWGSGTYNDAWVYVVSAADINQNQTVFFESMTSGETFDGLIPWSGQVYYDFGNNGGSGRIFGAWGGTLTTPNIWTLASSTGTSTPTGNRKVVLRDGAVILSNSNLDNTTGGNQPFFIGGGYANGVGTSNPFDGRIAEMIVFGEVPTELEQEKIHSYLALKYGIGKNSADIAGTPGQDERDYFASDGSVIWDFSANAPYNNRIAGIGRDDNSALDQRKSQNIATQSVVSMDKGAAFTTDKDFVMWGHDTSPLGLTNTNAHPSLPYRLARVWRVDTNGTPGAVTVGFDLSVGIYNSGNASDYRLIYKSGDSNFSSSATAVTGTFVGNVITFTGVTFADGDYFTLAVADMPAPGGVVPNMHYWVKADQGVIGGGTASSWSDQSGNAFNVSQGTAGSQPTVLSNRTNFNPVLQFDGTNDQLTLTGGIMSTNTYTDLNVFMLTRVNTVQASSVFFESQASGGRINTHAPWSDNNIYWDAGGTGASQRLQVAWGGSTNVNYIWNLTASTTATASGARQDIYRNGRRIANDANMASFTGNGSTFFLGSNGSGNYFNGEVGELVMYRGALTNAQLQRIQSYLAIKYGVTLDQTTPTSYYASDWNGTTGTIVWDAAFAGVYRNDIAAIGRDDNSLLNQKQSASVNSNNILTVGNVAIAADNASNSNSFGTNRSFFSWAHNAGAADAGGVLDFGTTTNSEVILRRLSRVWLARETGTVGSLKIRINMSNVIGPGGIVGSNDLAYVRLLVDADGVFATGSTSISPTAFDNTTDIVEFDHDFSAGSGFYFTVGSVNSTDAPLPVQLVSFTAMPTSKGTTVQWVTSSELNSDQFTVQVSKNSDTWTSVATVKGKGTTNERSTYEVIDETPFAGKSYYRLAQKDFDGKVEYSNVVAVTYDQEGLILHPNPANETVKVAVADEDGSVSLISVSSLQGVQLLSARPSSKAGQAVEVNVSALLPGTYVVTVETNVKVLKTKLVIVR